MTWTTVLVSFCTSLVACALSDGVFAWWTARRSRGR
jgi:hypothetical protein